jgi:hypothetical protein
MDQLNLGSLGAPAVPLRTAAFVTKLTENLEVSRDGFWYTFVCQGMVVREPHTRLSDKLVVV